MNVHIVTEGKIDELIVRQLLRSEMRSHPEQLRVIVAGGRSSAQSLARSILGARREPVALVVDSDVTDENQLNGQREFLTWYMSQAGAPEMWQVVLFRPTVESVLFADPGIICALLHVVPDEQQRVRAEYDPKRVLHDLLLETQTPEHLFWNRFGNLEYDWDALAAKSPEVLSLKEFIRKHCEPVAA